MFRLALKNGVFRPVKTLLTIVAIAAVIAEILILEGFLAGTYAQLRQAVLQRGGDVIVAQKGITNFVVARSILPQLTREKVEALPGVVDAKPLTILMLIYEQNDRRTPIFTLVYDDAGGPTQIVEGHAPQEPREIVIDRSLAQRYGLAPGDILTLSDYEFTISGITENAAVIFTPFAFMSYDGLIDFYFESDVASDIAAFPLLSFLLVDLEPGTDPNAIIDRIDTEIEDAGALLPEDLASNEEKIGKELFGPVLSLLLGLSYGIGALAIGLFMFAAVRSRQKSLAVLRALGFTTRNLMVGVIIEAIGTVVLALPLGILIAAGLARVIAIYAPVYLVLVTEPSALLRTGLIVILLAILGALAPLGTLRRLDPATAFRG